MRDFSNLSAILVLSSTLIPPDLFAGPFTPADLGTMCSSQKTLSVDETVHGVKMPWFCIDRSGNYEGYELGARDLAIFELVLFLTLRNLSGQFEDSGASGRLVRHRPPGCSRK